MPRVQTTEQTGKRWKALQLIGLAGILGGAAWGFAAGNMEAQSPEALALPALCVILGLPLWLFARVGAWWFHG